METGRVGATLWDMSLVLHLSPELEERLRLEAEQRGLKLEELLEQDLEARWGGSSEDTLLLTATQGLSESFWQRYRQLVAKREAEALSALEREELIRLSDQAEALSLERTKALLQLSKLRGVEITVLQEQLGLLPMRLSA